MSIFLQTSGLSLPPRLQAFDLSIKAGEFVGLIGPNGAGKTTFLRAALGLLPAKGESSLTRYPVAVRPRHVSYLAQDRSLIWPISVRDLLALGARANPDVKGDGGDQAEKVLRRLDLLAFADRKVDSLSGGEKARVLMARALAQNAPLLLADEPCAALDPAQARSLAHLMRAEAEEGRSVLASLHDLPLAASFCHRVLVMKGGALIAQGAPKDVMTAALMSEVFGIGFERLNGPSGPVWAVTG